MSNLKPNDPFLELSIPKPRDPSGKERDLSMAQLRQKIHDQLDLLTRNGQVGRNTFGSDVIDNAGLNHDTPGFVKVTLAIPVPPLLTGR